MSIDAVDCDVPERRRSSKATGIVDHGIEHGISRLYLINCRPLDRTKDRDLCSGRRDEQRVATLKAGTSLANPMQEELIEIDILDQLVTPIVTCDTERTNRRRTSSCIQRAQWRSERANVIAARPLHIAIHINA